jgi:hypothetical protein
MRSKAPLALLEQLVMVLVFALAAALCVQVFVLSDRTSRHNEARDRAVVEVQNVAETLKACHGDYTELTALRGGEWNGALWGCSYDSDWAPLTAGDGAYHLLATPADSGGQRLLGGAQVAAYTADGDLLYELSIAWQEVEDHG